MNDRGISEIVGEMLLLSIVVTLVAILSSNILTVLPNFEEVPYARFNGINVSNEEDFLIFHEGGDSIPLNDLRVIIDNGSSISCNFNGSDLYCNGITGFLDDENENNCWDFGEALTIYKSKIGEKAKIVIAHRRQVLCKIFFV